ncbi:MAG TPA: glycosyltransferase family 4 protein [Actinomycetota bacterium]|nr:glycosyltransferase family 4 protein [Actinomycetota bacterium]
MRVLYIIDSLGGGGAEHSLAAMAPHLVAGGIDLEVAYLKERPGLHDQLQAGGVRLFSLAGEGGRAGWVRRARRLILERRPALVHTTLFEADLAGRTAASLTRTPVVSSLVNDAYGPRHVHDPGLKPWKVRGAQLADLLTARVVRRFHAVSGAVADAMSRRLLIPRDRIVVIPRGRDPVSLGVRTPTRRRAARGRLGVPESTPLIVAAARHEWQKGLDVLLEAMPRILAHVPDAHLLIAGREGRATRELAELRARLGPPNRVRFLGPRGDVPDLLCAADVFVLPSRWEGFPGLLIEAMALETPIVATDLPAVREAVGGSGVAVLVPPDDPAALASAVAQTLRQPETAADRAREGRRRFLDHFTVERVAARMFEFYATSLNEPQGETTSIDRTHR